MISRHFLPLYPEYTAEFKDIGAGAILSALRYEYEPNTQGLSRLRIWKHQRWWVAKDHHELTTITALTSRQLQTAIGKLVKSGRVVVKIMMFNGAPTRHFRVPEFVGLCPRGRSEEAEGYRVDVLDYQPLTYTHVNSITESYIYTTARAKALANKFATAEQNQEQSQELPGSIPMQSIAQTPEKKTPSGWMYQLPPVPMESKTVADIQTIMALKNANKVVATKPTVPGLSMLWHKRMATEYGGFQKPLTSKEKGQLKLYLKAAGSHAVTALDHALQNWTAFAWRAKAEKGLTSVPERPVVGFLLAHLEVAVQSIAQPEPSASPSPTIVKAPIHKTVKVATKAKEDVASADEVQAMIDELKGL